MVAHDRGELTVQAAEDKIFDLLASANDLPPMFPFADRTVRFGSKTISTQLAVDGWLHKQLEAA
jgi:hypothetical protein